MIINLTVQSKNKYYLIPRILNIYTDHIINLSLTLEYHK